MNLFRESEELFIDGTFKMSPKNYYQILYIWGYLKRKKNICSTNPYFNDFKKLILLIFMFLNQWCCFSMIVILNMILKKIITPDYERVLRTSKKDIIKPKALNRCYFHFDFV